MKFGSFLVEDCLGAYLAHSVLAGNTRLRKGKHLTSNDLELLRQEGISHVTVAMLEEGDVHEDAAAELIAEKVKGTGMTAGPAFTGRVNLCADYDGVFEVDAGKINSLNRIDEALTIATLADFSMVTKGQMVATAKVIPLGAREKSVSVLNEGDFEASIMVHPYVGKRCRLLQTKLPGVKEALYDKTAGVLKQRLKDFGASLNDETRCEHGVQSLASTLLTLAETDELILIMGASAITDRRDVIPAAIERAGGHVIHFGMPVDPGNLLLVAKLGEKWVLGLPGCARSPKLNGIDYVLSRLCAGLNIRASDITGMGVGGLLSEYVGRPQPREGKQVRHASTPSVAAAILAAGRSSRMGEENKLLLPYKGQTVLDYVIKEVGASGCSEVFVVTGHDHAAVETVAARHGVRCVHNEAYMSGMSSSVKLASECVSAACDAVLMVLADMPGLTQGIIKQLVSAYNPTEGRNLIMPVHHGKWGNPVLWGREYFERFRTLEGDKGAKTLLRKLQQDIVEVDVNSEAIFMDIDTAEAYRAFIEAAD